MRHFGMLMALGMAALATLVVPAGAAMQFHGGDGLGSQLLPKVERIDATLGSNVTRPTMPLTEPKPLLQANPPASRVIDARPQPQTRLMPSAPEVAPSPTTSPRPS